LDSKALIDRLDILKEEISKVSSSSQEKEHMIESAGQNLEELKKQLHKEEINLANKEALRRNIESEKKKIDEEISLVDLEISETNDDVNQLEIRRKELGENLENLNKENENVGQAISENQTIIVSKTTEREETMVEISRIRTELVSFEKEMEGLSRTLKMLETSLGGENSAFEIRIREIEESLLKRQEVEEENKRLEDEIQILLSEQKKVEEELVQNNNLKNNPSNIF